MQPEVIVPAQFHGKKKIHCAVPAHLGGIHLPPGRIQNLQHDGPVGVRSRFQDEGDSFGTALRRANQKLRVVVRFARSSPPKGLQIMPAGAQANRCAVGDDIRPDGGSVRIWLKSGEAEPRSDWTAITGGQELNRCKNDSNAMLARANRHGRLDGEVA